VLEFISTYFSSYSSEEKDVLRLLLSVLALCLVLAGWFFLRRNAHVFAKRSEMNNAGKEISALIDKIASVADDYWLSKEESQKYNEYLYQALTNSFLERLLEKETILRKYGVFIEIQTLVTYRQSLTLNSKSTPIENNKAFANVIQQSTLLHTQIEKQINNANLKGFFQSIIDLHPTKMGIILGLTIGIMFFCLISLVN
jgi:hypothetical protein